VAAIRYFVTRVEESIAFYECLGFEVEERWGPAFAILVKGDLKLWISGPTTSAAQPMPDGRVPGPGGWNRIVVEVDDLEDLVDYLRKGEATFRNDIVTGPGGKQILLDDPDGNPIELFQARA
jgi:catechol 2,3-dioxygenase-like lactoylglutathione lyase family enzyme